MNILSNVSQIIDNSTTPPSTTFSNTVSTEIIPAKVIVVTKTKYVFINNCCCNKKCFCNNSKCYFNNQCCKNCQCNKVCNICENYFTNKNDYSLENKCTNFSNKHYYEKLNFHKNKSLNYCINYFKPTKCFNNCYY